MKKSFLRLNQILSQLRIFECPVYIHVPKEKRTKLEPSRRKGIVVGYSETPKHIEFTYPVKRTLNLVEMLYLKKSLHSIEP